MFDFDKDGGKLSRSASWESTKKECRERYLKLKSSESLSSTKKDIEVLKLKRSASGFPTEKKDIEGLKLKRGESCYSNQDDYLSALAGGSTLLTGGGWGGLHSGGVQSRSRISNPHMGGGLHSGGFSLGPRLKDIPLARKQHRVTRHSVPEYDVDELREALESYIKKEGASRAP